MKRACLIALAIVIVSPLTAQVTDGFLWPQQSAKAVEPGELSPSFWIGGQAVTTLGRDMGTGRMGMAYSTNQSWVSFNVAFVDSHYDTPKRVFSLDDPTSPSVTFRLLGMTAKINSYDKTPELNPPQWVLGIQAYGWRFGFLNAPNQPGGLVQGMANSSILTGANETLYLGQASAGSGDGLDPTKLVTRVEYDLGAPAVGTAYASYEWKNRGRVSLTGGWAAPNKVRKGISNGYVAALNFQGRPWGESSSEQPLAVAFRGDLIGGRDFAVGNPIGLGLQTQVDAFLDDDVMVSPLVSVDLRLNDTWTPGVVLPNGAKTIDWAGGAGVLVSLSPKQWVGDVYGEAPSQATFANVENANIQKFTFAQVMVALAKKKVDDANRDLDLVIKAEEPDGIVGLDDNLGLMTEFRGGNLLAANVGQSRRWSALGRVSYDFSNHTISPYFRWYRDSGQVTKVRVGVQVAPVPGVAIEATYMSANLSSGAVDPYSSALPAQDPGRLVLLVGFATDPNFRLGKNMNFAWAGTE